MKEIVKFLNDNDVQYLATIGLDGKPKVRPFQFMMEEEGKLYFCTNNQKDVYAEIKKTPYIEVTISNPKFQWVRLSGEPIFISDMDIKRKVINSSELVKSIYKTEVNPIFEVFYIGNGKATLADFSGNPPKEYNL
ncbi:pyridoxamine 5'-phosphate oxidase family protein [Clostridium massiliamazoniense]|uniref:pyridoxamine 5'-phosphate oxidase family protein n=1 Tax=Clostridium massiliamazoniense TaxID=1347366 RepID=UPI0006D78898|nr:pyridoxamine 5'-phosphate oxidase family protein [Clostridium massiliamazoniense]